MTSQNYNSNVPCEFWGFFILARNAARGTCNHLHQSGKNGTRDSNLPARHIKSQFVFYQGFMD